MIIENPNITTLKPTIGVDDSGLLFDVTYSLEDPMSGDWIGSVDVRLRMNHQPGATIDQINSKGLDRAGVILCQVVAHISQP